MKKHEYLIHRFKKFRKRHVEHLRGGKCNVRPICVRPIVSKTHPHTAPQDQRTRWGQHTHHVQSLVCADVLCVKHEFRTLARFLDPSATDNKECDSLP